MQPFIGTGSLKGVSAHQRWKGGTVDREFDRFVATASPGLLRAAYLMTGDTGEAEDLLQTALLRVFRRWGAIAESPTAYAFTVLMNLSRDHRRRLHRQGTALASELRATTVAVDPVGRLLDRSEIVQAARRLPGPQQAVIACRYLLDFSVTETAVALDLPEGTVKSYTARALATMRDLLTTPAMNAMEVETC
jgi:RNA polymerase sigma-70 factor (sigma-E family)